MSGFSDLADEDNYYCVVCEHPKGYHVTGRGCSMPVIPGTNIPKGPLDTASERCACPHA